MNGRIVGRADSRVLEAVSPKVFTKYFDFSGANDGDLLRESYRIRYQVYCEERGFLNPADYSNLQESDEYDAHSIHVLACHRNGETAGAARLILHSPLGFPCQSHCAFDDAFSYLKNPVSPRLANYGEISRLVVSRMFRRRARDTYYGGEPRDVDGRDCQARNQRASGATPAMGPEIMGGICKYFFHESKRLGVTHWLIAVEPALHALVTRMGWPFMPVGPEVDYFGPVRPYLAEAAVAERILAHKNPSFYAFLIEGLPSYQRQGSGSSNPRRFCDQLASPNVSHL